MLGLKEGSVVHIENYKLPEQVKNKFFIVLFESKSDIWLLSMTTSKKYVSEDLIKHGRIIDRDFEYYCFKANHQICTNEYSFPKDTFVKINRDNVLSFTKENLDDFSFTIKGVLTREELIELLYAFYVSDKTINRIKNQIEPILFRLHEV